MNIGDVIRLIAVFNNVGGDKLLNVFTFLVTAVGSGVLSDIATDLESWLDSFYAHLDANVASSITSESFSCQVRDDVAGEWNTVIEEAWTNYQGQSANDSSIEGTSPHLIAYPGQPRHRGSKFLPPVDDASVVDSLFIVGLATDLGLTLAQYISPLSETNLNANPGVYELSTETFRGFAGSGTFSFIPAYQRRRKQGVGF